MTLYIKVLEIVDDRNNRIYSLRNCIAEKGLMKAINYVRVKDSSNVMKRMAKFLDEDFKKLLGFEDE